MCTLTCMFNNLLRKGIAWIDFSWYAWISISLGIHICVSIWYVFKVYMHVLNLKYLHSSFVKTKEPYSEQCFVDLLRYLLSFYNVAKTCLFLHINFYDQKDTYTCFCVGINRFTNKFLVYIQLYFFWLFRE